MAQRLPSNVWRIGGLLLAVGLLLGAGWWRGGVLESAKATPPAPGPIDAGAVAVAAEADSVPFDHSIHAGTYKMACLFCHTDADKSTTAGLPSVRLCMGCHKFVDKEKPAVQQLARLWEDEQAPRWSRVYEVPDYVYFSHRVHVGARVACAECHGDVPSMTHINRVSPLTMGWCLGCHEERHATRDCAACHQ